MMFSRVFTATFGTRLSFHAVYTWLVREPIGRIIYSEEVVQVGSLCWVLFLVETSFEIAFLSTAFLTAAS